MSLYSDLNEVLTPYAQRIKGLATANEEIKADLDDLDDGIYNGYKNVRLNWEHGWVNSNGDYDPNSNRYLIKGKSTAEASTVINNTSSTVYITYFSSYTDLTNFTYDSFVSVQPNGNRTIDKTKPYFLIESTATTESGLAGVALRTDTPISYLSKAKIDSREHHKQNIYFAYCQDIFWSINGYNCSLRVNSNIRVRFDTKGASVDTTPTQLISIAQASTANITVSDGVISGRSFVVIFNFDTNAIEIVDPSVQLTYVNTVILFYWHYGILGGILVNNKTALDAIQNTNDIVDIKSQLGDGLADYFVTEAETCRNSLIADCGEKAFVVAFTTDNHYGVSNGMNFPTTVKTIKEVNDMYQFDLVVDGGDLINGDKPKADAINLLTGAVNDLIEIGRPAYTLLGNHDDDSYTSTSQPLFSKAELYAMMYRHSGFDLDYVAEDAQYGYKDFDQYGLRIIFLDSVYGTNGHSSADWGYSDAELAWFTSNALNTTNQIVMFSHMGFTADYMAYGTNVKNGAAMRTAVENFIANGGVVVGLFHGHNHWDYIGQYSQTNGFHEVSTGCSRIISGPTISYAHPEGAVMPERTVDTVTQELWDIIVIKPESRAVNMIRFGAGDNRNFTY